MRALFIVTLGCLLAGGAVAQRGGARGGGGGMRGGGSMGGFHGSMGGGFRGTTGGGFRGTTGGGFRGTTGGFRGTIGGGFRNGGFGGFRGFNRGFVGSRFGFGFGGYWGGYWPYYSYGLSYWPYDYYSDWDYPYPYYGGYGAYDYPAYQSSPNVTVVYPNQAQMQPAVNAVYVQRANPVIHEYDEYGQEVRRSDYSTPPPSSSNSAPTSSPIYLIAMKDGVIRAASSYSVNGQTLHYVTLEHQERQVPLAQVDRSLSLQLNHERRVQFGLPQ